MSTPLEKIRRGAAVLVVTFVFAVCGFRLIGDRSWLESIYMVVITISSVGFSEQSNLAPSMQAFVVVVILVGMSAAAYTLGGLFQMMNEGEIDRALGVRRLNREIQELSDHVIICGHGRMGEILAADLKRQGTPLVVIDNAEDRSPDPQQFDYPLLTGDATKEDVVLAAGVQRARCLVTTLPVDADNVFITLTARTLNQDIQIIARADQHSSEKKLIQAGANRVVLPTLIGARQISTILTRPYAVELFELAADGTLPDVQIEQVVLPDGSPLIGATAGQAEERRERGVLIVAVRQRGGQMVFNPAAEYVFQQGDALIVMASANEIETFRERSRP